MNITISLGRENYGIKKLLDLVNSVVIKCSLSLKDGTDKSTCKKTFPKLRMVQNSPENCKNLFKGVQYKPKTLNHILHSSSTRRTAASWIPLL